MYFKIGSLGMLFYRVDEGARTNLYKQYKTFYGWFVMIRVLWFGLNIYWR